MNNGYMGMVRQWQDLFWDGRHSGVELGGSPDWAKLAEAFGAKGVRIDAKDELEDAMAEAIAYEGTALIDVRVTPTEDCLPMFAAGQPARDMVG